MVSDDVLWVSVYVYECVHAECTVLSAAGALWRSVNHFIDLFLLFFSPMAALTNVPTIYSSFWWNWIIHSLPYPVVVVTDEDVCLYLKLYVSFISIFGFVAVSRLRLTQKKSKFSPKNARLAAACITFCLHQHQSAIYSGRNDYVQFKCDIK